MNMKRVEFDVPKGYMMPEGIKEGDTFQELVTLQYKGGEKACITMMGETEMYGVGKDEDDYPDKEGDYRARVESGAAEAMGM